MGGGELTKEQVFGQICVKAGTTKLLLIIFVLLRCRCGFFFCIYSEEEEWKSSVQTPARRSPNLLTGDERSGAARSEAGNVKFARTASTSLRAYPAVQSLIV